MEKQENSVNRLMSWTQKFIATSCLLLLWSSMALAQNAPTGPMCTGVVFELGIVAGWVTNQAKPGEQGQDRWVRNDELRLLATYRKRTGFTDNYYDELYGPDDTRQAYNTDQTCPPGCRKEGRHGHRKHHHEHRHAHGHDRCHHNGGWKNYYKGAVFPTAPDTDYLSNQQAAAEIDRRYNRIFKNKHTDQTCHYQRKGANFYFPHVPMTCALERDKDDNILRLNCKSSEQ